MSKEYPCVYFREGGLCSYGGDLSEANICVFGPCENETPSRGDRIRTMSDEKLAEILFSQRSCPPGKSRLACEASGTCLECWTEWLSKPAAEDGST